MTTFNEYPYKRIDFDDLSKRFIYHTNKLAKAGSFSSAYYELVETDYLQKVFITYAGISEVGYTNNSYDELYAEEEKFFNKIKPRFDLLVQKRDDVLLGSPFKEEFKKLIGEEFFASASLKKRTVSESVLELMEADNKLSQEYSDIRSRLSIKDDGQVLTMPEINKKTQSEDRNVRKKYDTLLQKMMMKASKDYDRIYHEMVKIRTKIAEKTGFESYTDYCFHKHGRTSYGRKELEIFADNVEKYIVPVALRMFEEQEKRLGHEIKNYDESTLFTDRKVRIKKDPLESFTKIFSKLSPETKVFFDELMEKEFFNIELRKGKTNGAYSLYIPLCNMPYIFQTYNETEGAVQTFAHECGHGLHAYMHRGDVIHGVSIETADISETHSMSMEYFVWQDIEEIITENVEVYKYRQLRDSLAFIPYGTAVDMFQTRVYDNPDMTPDERRKLWQELEKRFLPWKNYEKDLFYWQGRRWQNQMHVMKWPFYYIDYVLAQVCALQYFLLNEEDHEKAWNSYIKFIKDSGKYSFVDSIKKAGLSSPFDDNLLEEISEKIDAYIKGLGV